MSFTNNLKQGLIGEGEIARFFISKGCNVLPAYQVEINSGKGPRLFGNYGQLISPDMLVFKGMNIVWAEAKTKSAFTWFRIRQQWQTGIDLRHWQDYLEVAKVTPFPVWLLFLHRDGVAKDTPAGMVSPTGLYGNEIQVLQSCVDHISDRHGSSGMIYWNYPNLKKIADLSEFCKISLATCTAVR